MSPIVTVAVVVAGIVVAVVTVAVADAGGKFDSIRFAILDQR